MRTLNFLCDGCGSMLQIGAFINRFTCNICGSFLQIHKSEDQLHAKLIETDVEYLDPIAVMPKVDLGSSNVSETLVLSPPEEIVEEENQLEFGDVIIQILWVIVFTLFYLTSFQFTNDAFMTMCFGLLMIWGGQAYNAYIKNQKKEDIADADGYLL